MNISDRSPDGVLPFFTSTDLEYPYRSPKSPNLDKRFPRHEIAFSPPTPPLHPLFHTPLQTLSARIDPRSDADSPIRARRVEPRHRPVKLRRLATDVTLLSQPPTSNVGRFEHSSGERVTCTTSTYSLPLIRLRHPGPGARARTHPFSVYRLH
jgi:hypothetical protein